MAESKSTVRFIGDVHGKFRQYKRIISECDRSIQVGDLGVGFFGLRGGEIKALANPPFDAMSKGDHRFIRGNHDNPQSCINHPYWIGDGESFTVGNSKLYFLGGAGSIDRHYRTEGLDWWPDEELSRERLNIEVAEYIDLKPDVVVTHDCPDSIANEILMAFNESKFANGSRTRQALDSMFYFHQPKYWIFGHWHKDMNFNSGGTNFICLGELSFLDLEL